MKDRKNLSLGIDSSLSYCSITVFKNEKIIWNSEKKCDFGHEKYLSKMLAKMTKDLSINSYDFDSLYLNFGPARFTCIRGCHALMKGYFINNPIKIYAYSIFEHYFLGISKLSFNRLACIVDTNRRDLGVQIINQKGELIGSLTTYNIDDNLINELNKNDFIIGNGINRLNHIDSFKKISKKCKKPIQLKSKYFINYKFFSKKPQKTIPLIEYPYSPI
ncbi:MAG: hypothetical protein CMI90_05595 [Pelagibacteraceae bacterium]|nr:hypothetical protein [Pelagibacteraceae bacterium]|tara:strand:- start:1046 stop:1699 length:654 start_codon:yes stop_codon:yes gene_type:complete